MRGRETFATAFRWSGGFHEGDLPAAQRLAPAYGPVRRAPRLARRDLDRGVVDPRHSSGLLALHLAHPPLHLDRGDGPLSPGLDRDDRRHDRRTGEHALRGRCMAASLGAGQSRGPARGAGRRAHRGSRLRVVGLRVHRVRVVPHLGTGRAAALAHPCRLAGDRRDLAHLPRRTDVDSVQVLRGRGPPLPPDPIPSAEGPIQ